jgi:hypothetical protein
MVALSRTEDQLAAALKVVEESDASVIEKAEMLMEIAMGLQQRPKEADDLLAAIELYEQAIHQCGDQDALLTARILCANGHGAHGNSFRNCRTDRTGS